MNGKQIMKMIAGNSILGRRGSSCASSPLFLMAATEIKLKINKKGLISFSKRTIVYGNAPKSCNKLMNITLSLLNFKYRTSRRIIPVTHIEK
jgi:hypothetical protein